MRVKFHPFLTKEQEKTASADDLVKSHKPLVLNMASKFARYGVDIEDLVQEGNLGLITAASKFEPERGFRFSTYAYWWVRQRMRDAVMDMHSVVRAPTTREGKATFFKKRPHYDVSMETPLFDDGLTFGDTFVSQDPGPDELVEDVLDAERRVTAIRKAMQVLNPREQDIIRSRFLIEKPETLDVIGSRHGISKERIRQIETVALEKLRKEMVI